ncbi:MAG: hypothetical protein LBG42_02915, partial [Treponema sp.]|nr:hypothetical protein [Treponema sp.]
SITSVIEQIPYKNSKMRSILQDLQANRRLADNPNPIGFSKQVVEQVQYKAASNTLKRSARDGIITGGGYMRRSREQAGLYPVRWYIYMRPVWSAVNIFIGQQIGGNSKFGPSE